LLLRGGKGEIGSILKRLKYRIRCSSEKKAHEKKESVERSKPKEGLPENLAFAEE